MSRILINDAKRTVLFDTVIPAESALDRMRGLLGREGLEDGTAMLIRPCRSIHMWFMRFPIDAAFLDKDMQVLKIVRNLKPWSMAFGPRNTTSVLETPVGALKSLRLGERLEFESFTPPTARKPWLDTR